MPFLYLKYIQPTHYFSVPRTDGSTVYPIVSELPEEVGRQLSRHIKYSNALASDYDLSFQAIQRGYLGDTSTYHDFEKLPIADEYRFVRRYFNPVWTVYILVMRLLSLKNPIREISGWRQARDTVRAQFSENPIEYESYKEHTATLLREAPLVSVIIPTLNRYEYLYDVMKDLEAQEYKNFEVIVVDQTEAFQPTFYDDFQLNINLIRQEEKALWLARNTAIEAAKGDLIALSEDDIRIQPNWLVEHLKCLDYFHADVSAGVFYPEGYQIPKERSYFAKAAQFATGNSVLYKSVFQRSGLFDRQFEKQRMGDGEFGMRIYLSGNKSISNPLASCIDVKAGTGGLRQMGSWDAFRPKSWLAPRPIPSVLYYFRKYFGNHRARLALIKTVPPSIIPYRFKKNKKILIFGIFISILLLPLICLQVAISWSRASKKLTEGALIRELD